MYHCLGLPIFWHSWCRLCLLVASGMGIGVCAALLGLEGFGLVVGLGFVMVVHRVCWNSAWCKGSVGNVHTVGVGVCR